MSRRRTKTRGVASRDERRRLATARNLAWMALSTAEKVASLIGRRGDSKRQLSRLLGT